VFADSVTQLALDARGRTVVCGSHAGRYAGAYASRYHIGSIILNDAAIGLDSAGIGGLDLLEDLGVPAAAVSYSSAAIGDAQDTYERGVISHVNRQAAALGCRVEMRVPAAVALLDGAEAVDAVDNSADEGRYLLESEVPYVWGLDSAALACGDDLGAVLITGSHGGLVGGRPEAALRVMALGAVFNDAGGGPGTARLPALDIKQVPAATVSAASARIGDARSTYADGIISQVNETARRIGGAVGMRTPELVAVVREDWRRA